MTVTDCYSFLYSFHLMQKQNIFLLHGHCRLFDSTGVRNNQQVSELYITMQDL